VTGAADTRRADSHHRKLNIPALGLIENMSYFCARVAAKKRMCSGAAAANAGAGRL
jgi:Mrp family chromosome partitioning ATPase